VIDSRLRILQVVSEHGTVTAAAQVLHYTPSAVSYQLRQLSADVGVELVVQQGRGIRLTSAARTLLRHAERLQAQWEEAGPSWPPSAPSPRGRPFWNASATAAPTSHSGLPQTDGSGASSSPSSDTCWPDTSTRTSPGSTSHTDEALDDYFTGNPPEMFTEAAEEIRSFTELLTSDSDLDQATRILGLSIYPPEGASLRHWLTDVQDVLTHHRPTS
jgi:hypothetical protein